MPAANDPRWVLVAETGALSNHAISPVRTSVEVVPLVVAALRPFPRPIGRPADARSESRTPTLPNSCVGWVVSAQARPSMASGLNALVVAPNGSASCVRS